MGAIDDTLNLKGSFTSLSNSPTDEPERRKQGDRDGDAQGEQARGLPRFVVREFEEYLRCGRLDRGCLHLVCRSCGYSQVVAFSRKGLHTLVLDGVYVRDAHGALIFHALPTPTRDEVADVARCTADRVERVLRAAGRSLDPADGDDTPPELFLEEPGLAACYSAAAQTAGRGEGAANSLRESANRH